MKRLLTIGLDALQVSCISTHFEGHLLAYQMLPKVKLVNGVLYAESTRVAGRFLPIDSMIFYGIYEDDFDLITLLALWGGPCYPNPNGMMNLRLKHQALVRSLAMSQFAGMKRSMSINHDSWSTDQELVAKWGNWHCGDNKHRFTGQWLAPEATVFEPFVEGKAMRIMLIGEQHWQVELAGDTWLKSIHGDGAQLVEVDQELLEDAKRLKDHFEMEMLGIDYMVSSEGEKYLLEVNHIPSVSAFDEFNAAFLDDVAGWIRNGQNSICVESCFGR